MPSARMMFKCQWRGAWEERLRPVLGSWRKNPALATQAAWRQRVPRNLGGMRQFSRSISSRLVHLHA